MEGVRLSATAYDRVYDAARPEIFFKSRVRKSWDPASRSGSGRCDLERAEPNSRWC